MHLQIVSWTMLTLLFIFLKIFDLILLSWWWIVLVILIDVTVSGNTSNRIQNAYYAGVEEGEEAQKENREPNDL